MIGYLSRKLKASLNFFFINIRHTLREARIPAVAGAEVWQITPWFIAFLFLTFQETNGRQYTVELLGNMCVTD